jgi:cell division septation protein DedD
MSEQIVKRRPMIDLDEFERRLRKPLSLNQEDDNPLAELARFVGGQEGGYREDPYKPLFEPKNRRTAAALRDGQDLGDVRENGVHEPLIRGDFASIEAGLLGADHLEDAEGSATNFVLNHSEEMDGAAPLLDPETEHDGHDTSPSYEEIRSRRPLYVMAAMIVAGVAGIFASFAFKGAVSTQDEIATIKAIDGPAKVQPETAAGNENPSEGTTVLGGMPQQPPVAAVSNIEQPSDLSAQTEVAEGQGGTQTSIADVAGGAAAVPVPVPPAQAQPKSSAEPQSIADLIEPKKVKTVSVRPDGTLLPHDASPPAATPGAKTPIARPPSSPAAKAATPKAAARVATPPKPVQTANNNPQSAQVSVAPKAKASEASSGTFAVQLAAAGSEQEARDLEARLVQKFGTELAGFQPSIRKAEVGGKPLYRVRFTGAASREQATALCVKVQSGGGNCFVAKN